MSKELDNWYKIRFERHMEKRPSLRRGGAKYWSEFSSKEKNCVLKHIDNESESEFFLGFFGNCELWTVVGLRHVYSLHHSELFVGHINRIDGVTDCYSDALGESSPIYKKVSNQEEFIKSDFLRLDFENKFIWVPKGGSAMNGLFNLLGQLTTPGNYHAHLKPKS